ncbi:MAG TPA: MerR family transcriptional regulator [Chitinophagaceae bacterium]
MNSFTISDLARFSGVKPHTIRIWEQRYDALKPARSEGNTRYYDNAQLRRLLNMVSLISLGYRVSEACSMSDQQLFAAVSGHPPESTGTSQDEYYITQLLSAGLRYDEASFEKLMNHCMRRYAPVEVYEQIIYPLLQRTGLMWATDQIPPATEHFMSNILRQKIFSAIDAVPYPPAGAPVWLCFLREDEFHEIGLLFASYLLRAAGKKVIYLGPNLPFESLVEAVQDTKPEKLLTFLVSSSSAEKNEEFIKELASRFKKQKILVAAPEAAAQYLKGRPHVTHLRSAAELQSGLKQPV